MIDRMSVGQLPEKPHTVFRTPKGDLLYEEMFTRDGFGGAFSYFYHLHPITPAVDVSVSSRGPKPPVAVEAGHVPLKRRLYDSNNIVAGGMVLDSRAPILFNKDLTLSLAHATTSCDAYFANGDGDELWYIVSGAGKLESACGWLNVVEGDYVWIPRSLIHRWHIAMPMRMMCFEGHGGIHIPKQFRNGIGQLELDAPYTHRDFVRPTGPIATFTDAIEGPSTLFVKKGGYTTKLELEHCPMDVVSWEGFAYPWAFNISKYQPKTGMIHLPPTIHTTFAGSGFLVCSFVPRVTDTHPNAIPCPYPHSSVDCDEVILYLKGNFTSRRGVGPGAISLHPSGIAHGPHPGAYEKSIGTTRTDELAVMVDTYLPLLPTAAALSIEDPGYHDSWKTR